MQGFFLSPAGRGLYGLAMVTLPPSLPEIWQPFGDQDWGKIRLFFGGPPLLFWDVALFCGLAFYAPDPVWFWWLWWLLAPVRSLDIFRLAFEFFALGFLG